MMGTLQVLIICLKNGIKEAKKGGTEEGRTGGKEEGRQQLAVTL